MPLGSNIRFKRRYYRVALCSLSGSTTSASESRLPVDFAQTRSHCSVPPLFAIYSAQYVEFLCRGLIAAKHCSWLCCQPALETERFCDTTVLTFSVFLAQDAFIPTDRMSGRSRGFGFVTLDEAGAQEAITGMDGSEFMGRTIRGTLGLHGHFVYHPAYAQSAARAACGAIIGRATCMLC